MIIVTESFLKSTIFKMFSGVFKLILFKERFRKDVFVTDLIVWTASLTVELKPRFYIVKPPFSNFFAVVWTGPWCRYMDC